MRDLYDDQLGNVCVCGHHRDDHGPECSGDSGECGCDEFRPMQYLSEEELERRAMRRGMAGKPATEAQLDLLEKLSVTKVPKDRLEASDLIEEAKDDTES